MKFKRKILTIVCASFLSVPLSSCGPSYNEDHFSWTNSIKLKKDDLIFAFDHLSPDIVVTRYQYRSSFISEDDYYSFTIPGFETYQDYLPILDYEKTMKNKSWDDIESVFISDRDCSVSFLASVYDNPPADKEVFNVHFIFDFDNSLIFAWCIYDAYGTLLVHPYSKNGKYHVYKMDDEANKTWKNHFLEIYEQSIENEQQ